jgi:hypothetical protein
MLVSYQIRRDIIIKLCIFCIISLSLAFYFQSQDVPRKVFAIICMILIVAMILYTFLKPTLFGYFIHFRETSRGFEIEYLVNSKVVKRLEVAIEDLESFSLYNYTGNVPQQRLRLRFCDSSQKMTFVYKKKVKGICLQSEEIVSSILKKIKEYNKLNNNRIVRTPSFLASKKGLFFIGSFFILVCFALAIHHNAKKTLPISTISAIGAFITGVLYRYRELRDIKESGF